MNLRPLVLASAAIFSLALAAAASARATDADDPTQKELRALELRVTDQISQGDYKAVAEVLDDSYLSTNYHGVTRGKAEMLKLVRDDFRQILKPHYDTMTIRVFGDCAVICGIYSQAPTLDDSGQPNATRVAYTDTLVRKNGRWLYVMSQTTQVREGMEN